MAFVMLSNTQEISWTQYPPLSAVPEISDSSMEEIQNFLSSVGDPPEVNLYAYGALLIALMSALRLARFNVSQADTKHFIGLATPASTVFWFGLFQTWRFDTLGFRQNLSDPLVLLPIVALFSYLLVSNLPLFSNKLDPRRRANWPAWVVLAAAALLPWGLGWAAVPVVMILYVGSGLVWRPVSDQLRREP